MKKLFTFLLLLITISASAQFRYRSGKSSAWVDTIVSNTDTIYYKNRITQHVARAVIKAKLFEFIDRVVQKNDTMQFGVNYIIGNSDSVWIERPLGNFKSRIDITGSGGGSGSPVYASSGLYKDGDTIKLSGTAYTPININAIVDGWDNVLQLDNLGFYLGSQKIPNEDFIGITGRNTNFSSPPYIDLTYNKYIGNRTTTLRFDSTGVRYVNSPDTSLTTSLHLMTEAQTKREINAVDGGWRKRADATKYIGAEDSTLIKDYNDDTGDLSGIYHYYLGELSWTQSPISLKYYGSTKNAELSLQGFYNKPLSVGSNNDIASFNFAPTTTQMGMYISNEDTIKFGRNYDGIGQGGDYLYSTKSGNIGIVSNGVKTYEADSTGIVTLKSIGAEIYRGRLSSDTTQSIPTGSTPTKVTAFATNGQSSVCTADKDNDRLILNKIGWYDAELSISYNSGAANVEWVAYIFGNGTEIPSIGSMGKAVTSGDGRSTQLGGRFYVSSVPYYVDYRVTHNNGGSVNVTFSRLNLRVTYQGY